MKNEFFEELLASAKEAVEIHKGNIPAARVTTYPLSNVKNIPERKGVICQHNQRKKK